jgi:predicted metallopeptidase
MISVVREMRGYRPQYVIELISDRRENWKKGGRK